MTTRGSEDNSEDIAEETVKDLVISDIPLFSKRLLSELYAESERDNLWDEGRARQMLVLARRSRLDGFDPGDFHAAEIAELIAAGRLTDTAGDRRTAADTLLSDALLRYLHHFRFGKYNPREINRGSVFIAKADAESLKADMHRVLSAPSMAEALEALLPHPPFYENLKRAYGRYLAIADRSGWDPIPPGVNLTLGSHDLRVPAIRERLFVTEGFEDRAAADRQRYDAALAEAVKDFQRRSGLSADGVVGSITIRALNRPVDDRLLKIRANLERMRWLYNDLPPDYLLVDLTAYRLQLFRDQKEVWGTKVIIGTREDPTPMFRDEMEYVVFNPTWTMPPSIQKKMRSAGKKYRVYDRRTGRQVSGANAGNYKRYSVVQPAGPGNALGRVKFIFPNGHAIYLHDTPSKHLFSRSRRAYSHGCIRVNKPLTLAEHVLNQSAWDESQIKRVVRRGRTRHVKLEQHLPVLLYYLTAVADNQGRVSFRRDIYDRDRQLFAMLNKQAHGNRIAFPDPKPGSEQVAEQAVARSDTAPVEGPSSAWDTAIDSGSVITDRERPETTEPPPNGAALGQTD